MSRYLAAVAASLLLVWAFSGCIFPGRPDEVVADYRQLMRSLVQNISHSAKALAPDFIVIPQNGLELLVRDRNSSDGASVQYLNAIDGVGCEELFFGYDKDDVPTPEDQTASMLQYLELARKHGVVVLVTDYCGTRSNVDESLARNEARGYLSFAAESRELDMIPAYPEHPHNVNVDDVGSLAEAGNFLYVINFGPFESKDSMLEQLRRTDYDILIVDAFYDGSEALSDKDVSSLKVKGSGGARLVIAYMSIGEAEDYRYYWEDGWHPGHPTWLGKENPGWQGNYKVDYWNSEWQRIILTGEESYLNRIIRAGFDGVYLDLVDAFEYFE